jgi:hypothetical protein
LSPDTVGALLLSFAALANLAASLLSLRLSRRARRAIDDTVAIKEQFGRAVGFAAFCTTRESGAPEPLRKMAREALPPGTTVVVEHDRGEESVH